MGLKTRSDDLEVILAVTEYGGFSAAAEALDMQVARVSRSVAKVESTLGASIFTRTTRKVALTDEGRKFVNLVSEGLEKLQIAELDIINRGALPAGPLRVDAASPFLFHQIIPVIDQFRRAYPDIELTLSSNEEFVDLIEKRTDVAIRIGKLEDSSLKARALGRSPLYIVASPEYLQQHSKPQTPEDLAKHQLIGFLNNKVLNKWPLKGQANMTSALITPTLTASNGESVRQLALTGNGVACLSGFMIGEDVASGRLVKLLEPYLISNTDRELINAVYYPASTTAKRIRVFIDFIQANLTLDA
ncbi:LysR family transcriptional regulator [Paraglaciecola aquimarina]|uniref:LysR family transcriptional regulator n=1 Tax=Paraglaciecola aquimarina TaxID=1235557 RepID=A0ABU3SU63_9ALTE|nr:LysR family transcriptional regulator [Paraglaciecola aquimarina]MDU0353549.1 LysR family transcriptional regulator [Paraglaciecola aquimarina]